jgi:hypothetical protein
MDLPAADWVAVALIGAAVGIGELVARYRDAPTRAVFTLPASLYVVINLLAALAALALLRALGVAFGSTAGTASTGGVRLDVPQVLGAGFGAMAILRSSVFTARLGDQDVPIGPSSFLQIILDAADRAVDRLRAQARATAVGRIMADVSFAKARTALPTYCFALMQNLPKEDQEQFGRQIAALGAADMADHLKALALGLALMNVVGEDVLLAAITSLADEIRDAAPSPPGGARG